MDDTDQQLLALLRENARAATTELARKLGLSRTTVQSRIDRLERTDIQSFQYRRYHEAYPWLALASFLLYGLALALDMTLWRRLP